MFLAYVCRFWIKLSLWFACVGFFCLFLLCLVGVVFCLCVWVFFLFLKPFWFAGAWQEMSPSNNNPGLAGENPGSALLRNGRVGLGRLQFQQLRADCLWLRAASSGGLLWAFLFVFSCFKNSNILRNGDISICEDLISHSFCFAYRIVWTVLKQIWIENKISF